jgi:UDP-N-acetylmuramate--alanine ligase
MRPRNETQLHFVGIGGIGMSGIAEVLLNQGYRVSGSDLQETDTTRRLRGLGVAFTVGHHAENVHGAHVVVISSAVGRENPEVAEARRLRIPVIPRAEMLAELMRGKWGIAVAGTHGKTTTTSMLATVLTVAGLDPTLVIGGKVDSLGGNAKLGSGRFVVAEADESDGSFLQLPATYGVVTNIDNDHLDHYRSLEAIEKAFVDFVGKLPFYGFAAVCADDRGVRRCLERFYKPVVTYGTEGEWDFVARRVQPTGLGTRFEVERKVDGAYVALGALELRVPGHHNVLNALATLIVALELGVEFDAIRAGLGAFIGVRRRFEVRWRDDARRLAVVDDYGHHPTEISATLRAARAFWPGRIVAVFQPHRYSRTLHCHDGFLSAFRDADTVYITDIYAAGEAPLEGVTGEALATAVREASPPEKSIHHAGSLTEAEARVVAAVRPGDLVLCLGAGSISRLPERLVEALRERAPVAVPGSV